MQTWARLFDERARTRRQGARIDTRKNIIRSGGADGRGTRSTSFTSICLSKVELESMYHESMCGGGAARSAHDSDTHKEGTHLRNDCCNICVTPQRQTRRSHVVGQ